MKKSTMLMTGALAVVGCSLSAEVIAKYNFDGRLTGAKSVKRDKIDGKITVDGDMKYGPKYVPNAEKGEKGPVLLNPYQVKKVPDNYYRSYYTKDKDRDVLQLKVQHVFYCDSYQNEPDKDGKGLLPASGPVTIEMVFCLNSARGFTTGGKPNHSVILDMSIDRSTKKVKDIWGNMLMTRGFSKAKQSWILYYVAGKNQFGHAEVIEVKKLNAGQYYHIALTYDATGAVKLYIDGEVKGEAKVPANAQRNTSFGLARRLGKGPVGVIDAKIDAIAIDNTALTPDKFTLLKK